MVFASQDFKHKKSIARKLDFFFLSHDLEGQKAIARNLANRFVTGFQSIFHQLQKQLKTLSIFHDGRWNE
jgi:hypothetical protein